MNIAFQPLVSWPFFLGIMLAMLLAAGIPVFLQWRKGELGHRIVARIIFSVLFLFAFSMSVLRPSFSNPKGEEWVLVYGNGVEKDEVNFWKDSLQLRKTYSLEDFDRNSGKVYLFGDQFEKRDFYPLMGAEVQWIKPLRNGLISEIAWKGYLRKGEMQQVSFAVFSDKTSSKLKIGGVEGVEKSLDQGWNQGGLEFSVAGLGRVEQPLILESDTLAFLRYYVGPSTPKHYHFLAGFPNAEIRNLTQWLRSKGEKVTEEIQLSRDTELLSLESKDSLQVIFLDAGQLGRKDVQELVNNGQAALVIWNVSNPSETIPQTNRLFGTSFQVEKVTQESSRTLATGAEALPFSFQEKFGQKRLLENSWAIQFPFGKPVAMSLGTSTFPLFLQGNEEMYESIWGEVLSELEPEEKKSWRFEAPYLAGIGRKLELYQMDSLPSQLVSLGDTIFLSVDPVNPYLGRAELLFQDTAWIAVDKDLEVYAYSTREFPALFTSDFIQELGAKQNAVNPNPKESRHTISPWIWLIGILLSLGMLWLEPKLDY